MKQKEKNKNTAYKMRSVKGLKVFRVILWGCLILLMIRGGIAFARPDQTAGLTRRVSEVEGDMTNTIRQETEVTGFTEDFLMQWFTWQEGGADAYKNSILPYVTEDVLSLTDFHDDKSQANVQYVNAYRLEKTSAVHINVYTNVVVDVTAWQTKETQEGAKEEVRETNTETYIVKVPVQICEDGGYIVEDVPLIVNDTIAGADYQSVEVALEELPEENKAEIEEAVTGFLKAFCKEEQTMVEYYLHPDADKSQFVALAGSNEMELLNVRELKAYGQGNGDILCLVTYQLKDVKSSMEIVQRCNMTLTFSEGRAYIKNMDTKTRNLNLKEEQQ